MGSMIFNSESQEPFTGEARPPSWIWVVEPPDKKDIKGREKRRARGKTMEAKVKRKEGVKRCHNGTPFSHFQL